MEKIFYPESVAVVGISATPGNLGKNIVENMDRFGYRGNVYLVGRKGCQLGKRRIFEQIEDLPQTPDLAVLLVPARFIPETMHECGRMGVRNLVIETAGFGEFSEEGRHLENEIIAIAKQYSQRFVGPNCISIVNLDNGLVLPFVAMDPNSCRSGPVSLISQSGGVVFGGGKLFACENIGFNKLISAGNKTDLDENDYLEYLIHDPSTQVILLHLESISDGRRLLNLAGSTDKPVALLKANRSPASRQIASFHTAALSGDDRVCQAALAQAGIHRAAHLADLADLAKGFCLPPLRGNKLAVVGRSGGQSVMAADAAAAQDLQLPPLPNHLAQMIRERTRAGVIRVTNPLDLGDVFEFESYTEIIRRLLEDPGFDGVVLQHLHNRHTETEATLELFRTLWDLSWEYEKPVAACFMSEPDEWIEIKRKAPMPLFLEPDNAMRALKASYVHGVNRKRPRTALAAVNKPRNPNESISRMAAAAEVFERLQTAGMPLVAYRFGATADEAAKAAEELGFPVALKMDVPDLVHKSEAGGVVLHLQDCASVHAAASHMLNREILQTNRMAFVIQSMAEQGVEVILGTRRDPEFGPVVLVGIGGVMTEVFRDVSLRVAPISAEVAAEMIEELRGATLLRGFRGTPIADVQSLADLLSRFSQLLLDSPDLQEAEINPLIVLEQGRGCIAVDARMRFTAPADAERDS